MAAKICNMLYNDSYHQSHSSLFKELLPATAETDGQSQKKKRTHKKGTFFLLKGI